MLTAGFGSPFPQYNEKLRREAFKNHLTELVQIIPGMQYYSQTRKSVLICAREYVQQLQRRERRLRSMLMAHHMRERALVASLLHRGATAEEIGTLCAESAPGELERVAATVETLVADPAQAEGQTNEFGDAPSGGLAEADGNLS